MNKKSKIVEVCSKIIKKDNTLTNEEYQNAQQVIKELASNPNPNNRYELAQLIGFLVDDAFEQRTNYIEQFADVKRVGLGDKLQFKIQTDEAFALWQARGSTAQRFMVGTKYFELSADEISVAPAVELEQMQNGQIDFTKVVDQAATAMENKLIKQMETVIKAYWDDLGSPWYASGNGVVAASIDPLIVAVSRLGAPVILGDIAALQKFTVLTGFNNYVADSIAVEFHRNGVIGNYKGARLVQLVNPLTSASNMTDTLLDQGYIYIVPAGVAEEKRPLKVGYEGEVQTFETTHSDSRVLEIAMYKKVAIGLASQRFGLGFYEDTSL